MTENIKPYRDLRDWATVQSEKNEEILDLLMDQIDQRDDIIADRDKEIDRLEWEIKRLSDVLEAQSND